MPRNPFASKLRKGALAAVALSTALALAACGTPDSEGAPAQSDTLTLASTLDNNSFDRAALEIGNRVHYWMPVYDTLLVLDPEAKLTPNLATEWSYNDDNTVLNLKLRDDVEFTDGTPFNAEAVAANLEYLKTGTGQNSYMAASVDTVEILNDAEVNLVLSAPDPGLLGYLAVVGGAMASPDALEAEGSTPIGSGPYVLDEDQTTLGTQYVYTRNTDYWNADAFPYEKLVVKPISEPTARLNALKSGQVDVGYILPTSMAEAESSGLTVEKYDADWQGLFLADREGAIVPALADLRVRQAINHAIDSEAILKNLQLGEGEVTSQTFNTLSEAFEPELDDAYEYDLDKALQLMSDAGYADGFDVTMPDLALFPQVAPIIGQQLDQINIRVTFEKVSADASISEVLSGKYPMFFFSLGTQSAWQDFRKFAFSTSPWNTAKVVDPEMDALLNDAQYSTGDDQHAAMQEVNRHLVDNAWFNPWFRANALLATSATVDATPQAWNIVPWIRNFQPVS